MDTNVSQTLQLRATRGERIVTESKGSSQAPAVVGIPPWVWGVMLLLASTQPLLLLWIARFPPDGAAPTGLHITDSALFLYSMRMFETGFESLYATCQSPSGTHGIVFFSVPHLWPYGVLGAAGRLIHVGDYALYGLANGVCAFVYLALAYWFLRETVPKRANLAFLLFSLSGGLGGVLYIATGVLGLHGAAGFDEYFRRFALYELFEGPHLLPVLHMPRLYYTLSLGLCLGGAAAFVRAYKGGPWKYRVLAAAMFLPGTFIDMRYGLFVLGIVVLFLASQTDRPMLGRARLACIAAVPALVGAAAASALLRTNPAVIDNHLQVGNVAMWLSPFATVAVFHLLLMPGEVFSRVRRLPLFERVCVLTGLGYLAAFGVLFCAYQVYYGNILVARDGAVAVAISDWALLGALVGGALGLAWRRRLETPARDWVLLWFIAYLAVSISAFGRGWFMQYGPQRIEVLLWLPMCVLSVSAIQRIQSVRPRLGSGLVWTMCICGACSITVSVLCFQGPFGYRPRVSPYASFHSEVMSLADAEVMAFAGPGTVAAPIPASDVMVLRYGNAVVFGTGSFNMTDLPYLELERELEAFYSPDATEESRWQYVEKWCVDYVYCPDTWPVPPETVEQLRGTRWLEEAAAKDRATLFKVVR